MISDIDDQKRAEQVLEAKGCELQQLIDAIPALGWSARADGFAEFLNRRWLEYTGMAEERAVGWGWTAALHPDDRVSLVNYWQSLLSSGSAGETEARLRSANGEYRWFLFRGEPVRDASSDVTRWLGSNADIDDRERAEEVFRKEEYDLRVTLDTIPPWSPLPHRTALWIS